MIRTHLLRALATSVFTIGLAAQAAPVYLLDATTDGQAPDPAFTNVAFSLTYEDFNFDMLFSLNELLAFTGVFDAAGNYFNTLLGLPSVAGITGNGNVFLFGDSSGQLPNYSATAGTFTAFVGAAVNGTVPEPSPAALLLSAFAVLGLTRRIARRDVM